MSKRDQKTTAWVVAGALLLWWLLSRRGAPPPAGVTLRVDDPNYPEIDGQVIEWPPEV